MFWHILGPCLVYALLFLVCLLVDKFAPDFNNTYFRWPDMVKEFLGMGSWNRNLYINLWQLSVLCYPLYLVYVLMIEVSSSVIEEKRLETTVYLHNMGIGRRKIMVAKGLFWFGVAGVGLLVLLVENAVFALILQAEGWLINMSGYYGKLFFVSVILGGMGLFFASYHKKEADCEERILGFVLLSFFVSRLPAFLKLLSEILIATDRAGSLSDNLRILAERFRVLEILSPPTWCWFAAEIPGEYWICGAVVTVIMGVAAFSIYGHGKVMD